MQRNSIEYDTVFLRSALLTTGYGVTVQNGRIVGVPTVGLSVQYSILRW